MLVKNMLMQYFTPIPGKVVPFFISEKKSASLLDQISRFLSHQFVTWYLRSISKTKIVKFFCPCMSEHMIYIKNVTNVTKMLHQNVTNVTRQNIASKEIPTIEFHTKYMKLFVNMLSIICVLLKSFWCRNQFRAKSQTWPTVTWTLFLTLTKNLIFKDLYVLTPTGSTIINQKFVDSMFAPGALAIQMWNFPLFWSQTWPWNGPLAYVLDVLDQKEAHIVFVILACED